MSEFSREVLLARLEAAKVLCCCNDDAASDWLFDTLQAAWEVVNGPVVEEPEPSDGVVVGWIGVDSPTGSEPGIAYGYTKRKPRFYGDAFDCRSNGSIDNSVIEKLGLESSTLYEIRRVPHETMPESAE